MNTVELAPVKELGLIAWRKGFDVTPELLEILKEAYNLGVEDTY
jgi:hypothetical protein